MPTVVNTETAAAAKSSISMMRSLAWRMAFLARRSLTVCRSGAVCGHGGGVHAGNPQE